VNYRLPAAISSIGVAAFCLSAAILSAGMGKVADVVIIFVFIFLASPL
jgi:hypothetical protein